MAYLNYQKASDLLKVFAHPTRLMIVEVLLKEKKCVNEIKELLKVKQPNVSQHLSLLKLHGVVSCEQKGKSKCYCLKNQQLAKDIFKLLGKNNMFYNKGGM